MITPSLLTEILIKAANRSIPRKKRVIKAEPWWTPTLDTLLKNKNKLRNIWTRAKKTGIASIEETNYKIAHDQFTKQMKEEKTKSWLTLVHESTNEDPFGLVYRIIRRKISPPAAIIADSGIHEGITDALQNQVSHMFPKTIQLQFTTFPTSRSITLAEDFTLAEVCQCIKTIAKNKAPGLDLVTIEMIHYTGKVFIQLLTNLFNKCLHEGNFPEESKTALLAIVPTPGKTDYADYKSYRPVSLLSVMGKILDKLITERLMHFFTSNNFFHPKQNLGYIFMYVFIVFTRFC